MKLFVHISDAKSI